MPKIKRLHFKDINGLRFFAFIPIFLFFTSILLKDEKNIISVEVSILLKNLSINSFDFFFLLSSFLITSLALREYKYRNQFSLKKFYLRKILRLFPLLILSLFFLFYFHDKIVLFLKLSPLETQSITYYILGLPNYFSNFTNEKEAYTIAIWMVYAYLQFYIIWGIVLKYFKPFIFQFGIAFIAIGILSRIFHTINSSEYIFDTLAYGIPIGIGAIVANYNRTHTNIKDYFKNLSKKNLKLLYSIGILNLMVLYPLLNNSIFSVFTPFITSLFFIFIIFEQTFSKNSMFKIRKSKLSSRFGKISYGLLIFTPIVGTLTIIAFESLDKSTDTLLYKLIFTALTFMLTWVLSDLSYNFYEKIFNRIKRDLKQV
jgi:peptidoglycan/LPS O-acetylase OafA/YrhL